MKYGWSEYLLHFENLKNFECFFEELKDGWRVYYTISDLETAPVKFQMHVTYNII